MAEDMGISIPSNLAGLISGHNPQSESESETSFGGEDPLNVKEPRSAEGLSIDSTHRKSPECDSRSLNAPDRIYETALSIDSKIDQIIYTLEHLKSALNRTCRLFTVATLFLTALGVATTIRTTFIFFKKIRN